MLGFINTNFVETNQIKTIIIANETEIKNEERYKRIKEKTISRTLNFDKNSVSIGEIFKRYKTDTDYFNFLEKKKKYIEEVLVFYSQHNLRTIIFCLDILHNLIKGIDNSNSDLQESLIFFSFIISFEFKKGKLSATDFEDYKNLDKLSEKEYQTILITRLIAKKASNNEKDKVSQPESYEFSFYDFYKLNQKKEYYFFKSVYNYILSGFLDDSVLKKEITDFNPKKKNLDPEVTPEQAVFRDLQGFYWLDDDEVIEKKKNSLLTYALKGDYIFYEYGAIMRTFKDLISNDLIDDKFENIKSKLIEGLQKSIAKKNIPAIDLSFIDYNRLKGADPEIDGLIENEIKILEREQNKSETDNYFLTLQNLYTGDKNLYSYYNPFEKLSGSDIFERLKNFDVLGLRNFSASLDRVLRVSNARDFYSKGSKEMTVLRDKIEVQKGTETSRLKKLIWNIILNQLDQVVRHVS